MEAIEKPKKLIPEKIVGFKSKRWEQVIDYKEFIIYALSLGFNEDQLNRNDFKFTYELSDDFSVFPTYPSVLPIKNLFDVFTTCPGIPEFNAMMLLHGEEWVDFIKPLPTSGELSLIAEIIDVEDKGKGTVFSIKITAHGKNDNVLYAVITNNIFIKGLKGEGVKSVGPLKTQLPKVPTTKPLKEITYKTNKNQALYYRLGGNDPNPLHVDPDMAALGGFEKPILHGLCTYGMAGRAAYELFCNGKQDNLLNFKARFTSHVFPGESLKFEFWKGEGNKLIVTAKNVERGTAVLIGEFTMKNEKF